MQEPTWGKLVNDGYRPRILDGLIFEDVEDFGAVCIEGPKYCGKIAEGGAEAPAFLAVVEGLGQYAYVRDDGVFVLPITCLAL